MPKKREDRCGVMCPACGAGSSVTDSRLAESGTVIRRRRKCRNPQCSHRFTTVEMVAAAFGARGPQPAANAVDAERESLERMHRIAEEARRLADSVDRIAFPERAAAGGMLAGLQL